MDRLGFLALTCLLFAVTGSLLIQTTSGTAEGELHSGQYGPDREGWTDGVDAQLSSERWDWMLYASVDHAEVLG